MKMMCKACILTALLAMFLISRASYAESKMFCGEGRDEGAEHAYVSLIDSARFHVYVNGTELAEGKFGVKGKEDGRSNVVDIDKGGGKLQRFIFDQKASTAQEYSVDENDTEKKVGKKLKCNFLESKTSSENDDDSDSESQDS